MHILYAYIYIYVCMCVDRIDDACVLKTRLSWGCGGRAAIHSNTAPAETMQHLYNSNVQYAQEVSYYTSRTLLFCERGWR